MCTIDVSFVLGLVQAAAAVQGYHLDADICIRVLFAKFLFFYY